MASSGPHSNGYSLIRRILERDPGAEIDGVDAAERLLAPTRIYVKPVLALLADVEVRGLAHITGGGLTENLPRVLPDGLDVLIDLDSWTPDSVFGWLQATGNVEAAEMRRTFNMGVGMVAIVPAAEAARTLDILDAAGETAWQLGEIAPGDGHVRYT